MNTSGYQQTLHASSRVSGFGYWSGKDIVVEFRPARVDTGIVFVRTDMAGARLRLSVEHHVDTPLRTTLVAETASVEMVEHIAAALAGTGIDNCEVHVSSTEMPGMDGSAIDFVAAIQSAGIVEQSKLRRPLAIPHSIRLGDEKAWIEAEPCDDGNLTLEYRLDYGEGNAIGKQTFRLVISPESFRRELAPARTFMFQHEAAAIRSQGLGARVTEQDLLVFDSDGPIDNPLRFQDECVRHKMLDLVGDLALAGRPVVGRITAYRAGHQLNAQFTRQLLEVADQPKTLARCA